MRLARFGSSPKLLFSGTFAASNTAAYSLLLRSSMTSSSVSDEASSASLVQLNTEILMDFFWTLFSKLDAVLQGFRVLNDVVQRIVGRREFKDPGMVSAKSGTSFFSLYDVWRPVQCEVRPTHIGSARSVRKADGQAHADPGTASRLPHR
jgi:hypothetical protein